MSLQWPQPMWIVKAALYHMWKLTFLYYHICLASPPQKLYLYKCHTLTLFKIMLDTEVESDSARENKLGFANFILIPTNSCLAVSSIGHFKPPFSQLRWSVFFCWYPESTIWLERKRCHWLVRKLGFIFAMLLEE